MSHKQRKIPKKTSKSKAHRKVTKGDFHRAYKNTKKFDRLVARGKSPQDMVKDILRMNEVDNGNS